MIPLYGFVEGDTIGILMLARPEERLAELADRLQASVAIRVARMERVLITARGRVLDANATVEQTGLEALERFDVRRLREVA